MRTLDDLPMMQCMTTNTHGPSADWRETRALISHPTFALSDTHPLAHIMAPGSINFTVCGEYLDDDWRGEGDPLAKSVCRDCEGGHLDRLDAKMLALGALNDRAALPTGDPWSAR